MPYIYLGTRAIPGAVLAQVMRQLRVIPIRAQVDERGRGTLYVATSKPQDFQQLNALGVIAGKGIRAVLASSLDIHRALGRHGILEGRAPTSAGASAPHEGLKLPQRMTAMSRACARSTSPAKPANES